MNADIYTQLAVELTGFPRPEFDRVYEPIQFLNAKFREQNAEHIDGPYREPLLALHAVLFRFIHANQYREDFARAMTDADAGSTWAQRVRQERLLYGFFECGYSALDSYFYCMYGLGWSLDGTKFPFSTDTQKRRATPDFTREHFEAGFPGDPVGSAMTAVLQDIAYRDWIDIRRILTHRAIPARIVSAGSDPMEWKLPGGFRLDAPSVDARWSDFTRLLRTLLSASADFVESRLSHG